MLKLILAFVLATVLTGCIPPITPRHYCNFEPKFSPYMEMPKIAVIPVFDSSSSCLDWNISYEINQSVLAKIAHDRNLFLLNEEYTFQRVVEMRHFDIEQTIAKLPPLFGRSYFVVLVEIIQHDIVPYERQEHPERFATEGVQCNSTLMMKARLTIVDVRTRNPCILLDEIVNCNQTIPKDCEFYDYRTACWGSPYYTDTPCDRAHRRLAEVIVNRIQNVVWNAK